MPREIITLQIGQCGNQSKFFLERLRLPRNHRRATHVCTCRNKLIAYVAFFKLKSFCFSSLSCSVGMEFWKQLCAEHGIRPGRSSLLFCFLKCNPYIFLLVKPSLIIFKDRNCHTQFAIGLEPLYERLS